MNSKLIIVSIVAVLVLVGAGIFFKKPAKNPSEFVPLPPVNQTIQPQGPEDAVRVFIQAISDKEVEKAVNMLTARAIADDAQKQAWGVQFAAFKKITLKKIEKSIENSYQVTLDVEMNPEAAGGPIPYYGYDNGENIRFIGVEKAGNEWKIQGIATGP